MPLLHDEQCKAETLRRLKRCGPTPQRRWGKMSVAQMLWHVNEAMEGALGRIQVEPMKVPLPRPVVEVHGAEPSLGEKGADLETVGPAARQLRFRGRARALLRLIDELTSKSFDEAWPDSPTLGACAAAM